MLIDLAKDLVTDINDNIAAAVSPQATRGIPCAFKHGRLLNKNTLPKGPQVTVIPMMLMVDDAHEDACDNAYGNKIWVVYEDKLDLPAGEGDIGKFSEMELMFDWVESLFKYIAGRTFSTTGGEQSPPFEISFGHDRDTMFEWEWLMHHRVFVSVIELEYRDSD